MTGAQRAEARLSERFEMPCPPGRVTRQQLRHPRKPETYLRPGVPKRAPEWGHRILWVKRVGEREHAFHATKGLRVRRP